jgi:hypothetical protein
MFEVRVWHKSDIARCHRIKAPVPKSTGASSYLPIIDLKGRSQYAGRPTGLNETRDEISRSSRWFKKKLIYTSRVIRKSWFRQRNLFSVARNPQAAGLADYEGALGK